ncbi:MAG: universal stress protein [Acidobacteriota bacterium]|nr:universal stress protein [Acidobacteriota bacterium]
MDAMTSPTPPEIESPAVILICYDGSKDAQAAIQHGGELLAGHSATVLTVWQPVSAMGARAPTTFPFLPSLLDAEEIDQANAEYAGTRADEGAELARKAGFEAKPLTCSQKHTTAEAILLQAEVLNAGAILIGSRGLTGLKSRLLGSVSHAVVQHADRPVIVVPSPKVALSRTRAHRAVADDKSELEELI